MAVAVFFEDGHLSQVLAFVGREQFVDYLAANPLAIGEDVRLFIGPVPAEQAGGRVQRIQPGGLDGPVSHRLQPDQAGVSARA